MTHRLTSNYAKNYCNRTLVVKVIVENVVTCFFGTRCIYPVDYVETHLYDEVYSPLRQYGQYSDIQTSKQTDRQIQIQYYCSLVGVFDDKGMQKRSLALGRSIGTNILETTPDRDIVTMR